MDEYILLNKETAPSDSLLKSTLGNAFQYFNNLNDLVKNYSNEWKFYNKKSGWIYKVFDKKKALYWITPLKNNFNIGFALRENEKDALLKSDINNAIKEQLKSAQKYPEGYALRLKIENENDFIVLAQIIKLMIKLR